MKKLLLFILTVALVLSSCGSGGSKQKTDEKSKESMENKYQVQLITVDPGHFHSALVQKIMYDQVAPEVHLYAPEGPDYLQHLGRINSYNSRPVNPTSWKEVVYTGSDFFEKMLAEKAGNVVVLSGNNRKKAEYITKSINAGLNVLADKPMIITPADMPAVVTDEIQRLSSLVYDLLGCKGIVRVDFIIIGQKPYFLEINTVPGMTKESLVPKQVATAGILHEELYSMVVEDLF